MSFGDIVAPTAALGRSTAATLAFRVGGELHVAVVIKATFAFLQDAPMALVDPDPIIRQDTLDANHPEGSLIAASDLVPYRPRANVLAYGRARAPGGCSTGMVALRLMVARGPQVVLDKARTAPGEGAAGFGPISPLSPSRRRLLSFDASALEAPLPAMPADFNWGYFNVAPEDQRLDFFVGDEWIGFEGMSEERSRVLSRLPSVRAEARVFAAGWPVETVGRPVRLEADTLVIAADRLRCSVVWRASFPVASERELSTLQVFGGVELPGHPLVFPSANPPARPPSQPPARAPSNAPARALPDPPAPQSPSSASTAPSRSPSHPAPTVVVQLPAELGAPTLGMSSEQARRAVMPFVEPSAMPGRGAARPPAAAHERQTLAIETTAPVRPVLPFTSGQPSLETTRVPPAPTEPTTAATMVGDARTGGANAGNHTITLDAAQVRLLMALPFGSAPSGEAPRALRPAAETAPTTQAARRASSPPTLCLAPDAAVSQMPVTPFESRGETYAPGRRSHDEPAATAEIPSPPPRGPSTLWAQPSSPLPPAMPFVGAGSSPRPGPKPPGAPAATPFEEGFRVAPAAAAGPTTLSLSTADLPGLEVARAPRSVGLPANAPAENVVAPPVLADLSLPLAQPRRAAPEASAESQPSLGACFLAAMARAASADLTTDGA